MNHAPGEVTPMRRWAVVSSSTNKGRWDRLGSPTGAYTTGYLGCCEETRPWLVCVPGPRQDSRLERRVLVGLLRLDGLGDDT